MQDDVKVGERAVITAAHHALKGTVGTVKAVNDSGIATVTFDDGRAEERFWLSELARETNITVEDDDGTVETELEEVDEDGV